ncbi:MAG: hypothetical protein FGF48_09470 [Candidatus Brockarchaeota archaeon]|nr:hypothetical protein [Candidatus Brockarchaeota archaeon]
MVKFKIKLTEGLGGVVKGADVTVFSRFFEQKLFDDGKHGDAGSNNGIYANEAQIPSNVSIPYRYSMNNREGTRNVGML